MISREDRPLIFVDGTSNRIFCATRYTKHADGAVTVHEKFDVTDQVDAAMAEHVRRELKPRESA